MIDPAYKVVGLMWLKDLAETAVFAAIAFPVLRRVVKKYLAALKCPHCGKHFTEEKNAETTQAGDAPPSYKEKEA